MIALNKGKGKEIMDKKINSFVWKFNISKKGKDFNGSILSSTLTFYFYFYFF